MSNTDPKGKAPKTGDRKALEDLANELDDEPTIVIQGPVYVDHEAGQGYSVHPRGDESPLTEQVPVLANFAPNEDVTESIGGSDMSPDLELNTEAIGTQLSGLSVPAEQMGSLTEGMGMLTEEIPAMHDDDVIVLLDESDIEAPQSEPTMSIADIPLLHSVPGTDFDVTEMVTGDHLPELDDVEDIAAMIESASDGELLAPSDPGDFTLPVDEIPEERGGMSPLKWATAAAVLIAAAVVFVGQGVLNDEPSPVRVASFEDSSLDQADRGSGSADLTEGSATTIESQSGVTSTSALNEVPVTPIPEFRQWIRESLQVSLGTPAVRSQK